MTPRWVLDVAAATDRGRVRPDNEDSMAVDPQRGYAVLADGMGGYNAGEVASRIAVATIENEMRKLHRDCPGALDPARAADSLECQVLAANAAIYRAAAEQPAYAGMGTTIVVALWHDALLSVAHAGDSRLYRLRGDVLQQLTRDHSVLQEQIDLGLVTAEAGRHSPVRNLVTRALGLDIALDVAVATHEVRPGDLYLLCSDGLTDMVEDGDITRILVAGDALDGLAEALVDGANANGGRDNVSVVLAKVRTPTT